jgi:hypothetical protein
LKELLANLYAKAAGNPVGLGLAAVSIAVYGAGSSLSEMHIEPWGTLVQGVAAAICLGAGAYVNSKPKDPK